MPRSKTDSPTTARSRAWLNDAAGCGIEHIADVVLAACGGQPAVTELGEPTGGWADPYLIGQVHETLTTAEAQRKRGAWYTPVAVVSGLLNLATRGRAGTPDLIVDPSCGGGAFLIGALDLLSGRGVAPPDALGRVGGMDIDPTAVRASRLAVAAWALSHGIPEDEARQSAEAAVVQCDSLGSWPAQWQRPDLIAGNPPFASPLKSGAIDLSAQEFHGSRSARLGPYADLAAMHLLRAVEQLPPRGRVVFVLPQGVVSGRDTTALRNWLAHAAPTCAVWAAEGAVFAAGVRVWAPVLERAGGTAGVTVANGSRVTPVAQVPQSDWTDLAASALGIPSVGKVGEPLGSRVQATSGFRDEFYGLSAACREARVGDGPENQRLPVLTAGALDPLVSWWGTRPTKLGGQTYQRPMVDLSQLDARTAKWVAQNRQPKILLPTQTKVLEPVIDRTGDWIGATPVVLIHADPDALNHIAALLLAPPVVAWAARRYFGSGMSVAALRLAAKNIADLPTPLRSEPWNRAARMVAASYQGMPKVDRLGLLDRIAAEMNTAYDASPAVLEWWRSRLG